MRFSFCCSAGRDLHLSGALGQLPALVERTERLGDVGIEMVRNDYDAGVWRAPHEARKSFSQGRGVLPDVNPDRLRPFDAPGRR